jgi:hypothetical protein
MGGGDGWGDDEFGDEGTDFGPDGECDE